MISNYRNFKWLYHFIILLFVCTSCALVFNNFDTQNATHSKTYTYEWLSELQDDFVAQEGELNLVNIGLFFIGPFLYNIKFRIKPEYLARSPPLISS
ncbi:hypothetical protein MED121_18705 [Marinomonas sp. MED121]|nr:hypothetical protein MED121_18705 [Marinomonas sp. MED121]